MTDVFSDVASGLSGAIIREMEVKISMAIDARLGVGRWDFQTLKGRLIAYEIPGGSVIYKLDGDEIVEFYPPEFSTHGDGDSVKMVANQRYRLLADEALKHDDHSH